MEDKIDLDEYDLLNYDKIYFYKKTGGLLYQLIKNEIIRIDNSYDHKLHKHSLKSTFTTIQLMLSGVMVFLIEGTILFLFQRKKRVVFN